MDAVSQIEKAVGPGKITYYYYKDHGKSGRLEVTVFPNAETDEGDGILVHSKKQSHKYPHEDYIKFIHSIAEALGEESKA